MEEKVCVENWEFRTMLRILTCSLSCFECASLTSASSASSLATLSRARVASPVARFVSVSLKGRGGSREQLGQIVETRRLKSTHPYPTSK